MPDATGSTPMESQTGTPRDNETGSTTPVPGTGMMTPIQPDISRASPAPNPESSSAMDVSVPSSIPDQTSNPEPIPSSASEPVRIPSPPIPREPPPPFTPSPTLLSSLETLLVEDTHFLDVEELEQVRARLLGVLVRGAPMSGSSFTSSGASNSFAFGSSTSPNFTFGAGLASSPSEERDRTLELMIQEGRAFLDEVRVFRGRIGRAS
ncbi:hypothetical protein C8J56DRAFT_396374 [Mycena floridula]|nr:hypothetical protein C8J56DRAFT_396374 [Mycena floridula]